MHPFVAAQIAITFQHEAEQRTRTIRADLARRGPGFGLSPGRRAGRSRRA
jgi:hypothetical protein